jgi:peptide/nickel transport system substrate-binding protein
MRPTPGRAWLVLAAGLLLGMSCTEPTAPAGGPGRGGTVRVAALADPLGAGDPALELNRAGWELYRCCLLRTLLSYTGTPTERGGTSLHPDLAASPPRVSADGLRWTFRLKEGLRYAPPLEDVPIVAGDVVRALERQRRVTASYASLFSVIEGFDDFIDGRAASISGLVARDGATLVVRLTEPAGDLAYRLSLPAAAPVPPPVTREHDGRYASVLVASGPYMFAGSSRVDLSAPAGRGGARGYRPGQAIALVRNPSWQEDDLRPAYPDRIEVRIGGDPERIAEAVDQGRLDVQLDGSPPLAQVRRYQADPELAARVHVGSADVVRFVPLNVALPPFDDVHVRKAVNLAVDRAALRRQAGGPLVGTVLGHVMPEGVTGGRTGALDPFRTDRHRGDLDRAGAEMSRSPYDRDRDGTCDPPVCRGVRTLVAGTPPFPGQAALLRASLAELGIRLDLEVVDPEALLEELQDPRSGVGLAVGPTWAKLYPDGWSVAGPLFGREGLGAGSCCNYSLVGASRTQLRSWGYEGTVPSVEPRIEACASLLGEERERCWAGLDRVLSLGVVPWIPYLAERNVDVVSPRVRSYSFDQYAGVVALDRLSVAGESPAGP